MIIGIAAIVITAIFFVVPFIFIFLIASKPVAEANLLEFSWPSNFALFDNLAQAISARDYLMVIAFINSVILTVVSVAAMVIFSAMVAYVWQRRASRLNPRDQRPDPGRPDRAARHRAHHLGPAGSRSVQDHARPDPDRDRLRLPFCILLFRAFMSTVPRELDEAAVVDGAGPLQIFFRVIFPILRSVIMTVIILQSVFVYNDFQNPLYFLPGTQNATIQLTVANFQSQFTTQYNLLFAAILLVTIPPLIMFIFFNRKIVEGMAAGSVKG